MKNKKIKKKEKQNLKKPGNSVEIKLIKEKIKFLSDIIQNTVLYVQKYKIMDILDAGELNICIHNLENNFQKLLGLSNLVKQNKNVNYKQISKSIHEISEEVKTTIRLYGTGSIENLLKLIVSESYIENNINDSNKDIFYVAKKYIHPISYKVMSWREKNNNEKKQNKKLLKNRIVEDFMLVETATTLDCFDLARTSNKFQTKVYGIKICFQNPADRQTIIVSAICDDMVLSCINCNFISNKLKSMESEKPQDPEFSCKDFERFVKSLTLKELLIYSNKELYQRYQGYINQTVLIKKKTISQLVKEFIANDLYGQRKTLIQLLTKYSDPEYQYLAYLLYDLLSNESNNNFDTLDQTILFDSLPWNIKKYFRDAMKTTIKYTKNLTNFDTSKIPLEQQICLMKCNEAVKEKAMLKLKEVKAKSEDSGSKARQYLDGLLKIPFGIYKKEKILTSMKDINCLFKNLVSEIHIHDKNLSIPLKDNYTSIEIDLYSKYLKDDYIKEYNKKSIEEMADLYVKGKRETLVQNICYINSIVKRNKKKNLKILHSGKKIAYMKENIKNFILNLEAHPKIFEEFIKKHYNIFPIHKNINIDSDIKEITTKWKNVNTSMEHVKSVLDKSIYGHQKAKRQIERVIGQWVTGKQSGYCFGFEGPPGVGKTSLARKGLAYCLKDEDGTTRPFSFIALGGSSNGSTLSGHNYTYVGSTWGRIVDILMEHKCMNPIIFIDELDKVSRTENGKEIIGILTHLIDPTQNESYQDKYFSGIDIDLSNALFIFSYNDVSAIDRILLDRIHRIKFDHLTLMDKLEITKNYILPELYEKIGLKNMFVFDDETLKYIIETYTNESGVRKLKELLFEIISEINLEILKHNKSFKIPIHITKDNIKNIYLKEKHEIIPKVIHVDHKVGIINGLWANNMGMGGIIPIESFYFPSNTFMDLKLTGLQGDVMKESMNVAKTLAWKLTPQSQRTKLVKSFDKTKLQGIHIHCPEGSIRKDGPSAGTAITVALYSLLNNKKIKHNLAITGEMSLQGKVTIIGGLELKILGGIKAGIKHFLFPKQNLKDYNKIIEKYEGKDVIPDDVTFRSVETIEEVLKLVFV